MSKQIIIKNVRLSFPNLYEREEFDGKPGKFAATFILDPVENKADIDALRGLCMDAAGEKLKGKLPSKDRIALKSDEFNGGASGERPEYEGKYTFKATNKGRPATVDKKLNHVTADDGVFYSGCFVNAKVSVWAMDNKYGKRICGELIAVMFEGAGESFDGSYIDPDAAVDGFEGYSSEGIDDDDLPF
jgi:hypothetical protein